MLAKCLETGRVSKKTNASGREGEGGGLISGEAGGRGLQGRGLHAPDVPGVLRDGPVTGELARAGDVPDDLFGPLLGVLQREAGAQ